MGRENVFHDISKRKNSYPDYKDNVEVKIVGKIVIFSKGLVHGLGEMVAIFPFFCCCCFRQNRPKRCVSPYSRMKKRFSRLVKKQVKIVDKLGIFQRG